MSNYVILKEVTPKLTLTPNRITIKYPKNFNDKERINIFSKQIKNKLYDSITRSFRGCFLKMENGKYVIKLKDEYSKSSSTKKIYQFIEEI